MRVARVNVTFKLLEDVLHLPKGAKIVRINPQDHRFFDRREFEIVVEHDELENVEEGQMMPVRMLMCLDDGNRTEWA
jgi:hypothetical protein